VTRAACDQCSDNLATMPADRRSLRNREFTAIKSSANLVLKRDLLVRHKTQLINALRGHLAEFGFVVRQGPGHVIKLIALVEDPSSDMPIAVL